MEIGNIRRTPLVCGVLDLVIACIGVTSDSQLNIVRIPHILFSTRRTVIYVDVNVAEKSSGWTPLHFSSQNGQVGIVASLLRTEKVDIDAQDRHQRTALHYASANGHVPVVGWLLENKIKRKEGGAAAATADPNKLDVDSWAPIHHASLHGRLQVVKELLKHGAKTDLTNKQEQTALDLANLRGHDEIVALLQERENELQQQKQSQQQQQQDEEDETAKNEEATKTADQEYDV